jgi:RNA methyltransferase, TrmH family
VRAITSRHHRIVADYRAAARGESPDVLLLDGPHLVGEALAARLAIRHAAVRTDAAANGEVAALLDRLARAHIDVSPVSAPVMAALSPVRSSSTIVALADRPSASTDGMYGGNPSLVAIAVDVQDPGNVGAIVRVAEAAGASGVVAAGACANPFSWKALRGSMGSALRVPIASTVDVLAAIADARAHGCRIVATVPRDGTPVFDIDYTRPTAVVIGGEGPGLAASIVDASDERVTIPMQAPVESLNTAVAAAVVLYEARRQRGRQA